jgi:hypothetical protein
MGLDVEKFHNSVRSIRDDAAAERGVILHRKGLGWLDKVRVVKLVPPKNTPFRWSFFSPDQICCELQLWLNLITILVYRLADIIDRKYWGNNDKNKVQSKPTAGTNPIYEVKLYKKNFRGV